MLVQENELLEWQVDGGLPRIERVLQTNETKTGVWTIDISIEKAWPVYQRFEDLEASLATGEARRINKLDTYRAKLLPDDEYLRKHSKRAKRNYALIAPLVEKNDPHIYYRWGRGRMVAELSKQLGVRKAQIYILLRRYWQCGCVPNATLPEYFKCGQVKDRKDHGKKRGRPGQYGRNNGGRNVTAEDRGKFQRGIDDYKKTGVAKKLTKVWEL